MRLPETAVPPIALRFFRSLKAVGKYKVFTKISALRMVKPASLRKPQRSFWPGRKTGIGRSSSFLMELSSKKEPSVKDAKSRIPLFLSKPEMLFNTAEGSLNHWRTDARIAPSRLLFFKGGCSISPEREKEFWSFLDLRIRSDSKAISIPST